MTSSEPPSNSALPSTPSPKGRKRPISPSSSDTSDDERAILRQKIEQLECRTTFNLGVDQVDILEIVASLIRHYDHYDYYAYERGENWHIGLGSRATLLVDANGETMTIVTKKGRKIQKVKVSFADVARQFVEKTEKHGGGKIYGYIGFNYAAHVRSQNYNPGEWPLMSLMAPESEVTIQRKRITITGHDYFATNEICEMLRRVVESGFGLSRTIDIDTTANPLEYEALVKEALLDIEDRKYLKVIGSRAVDLTEAVDMPATLLKGRRQNTPARTFCLKHEGFEATGFSPELVLCVEHGKVITEPLAGTRSRLGTAEEVAERKRDLLGDTKEVMEHVISVKAAVDELKNICHTKTVCVEDLMNVKERGSVIHLGSRVVGSILPEKDGWDALDVLFPAITASGIPKAPALEAIQRLEPRPRELYSGAVLLIEGTDFFEATLVLRTVFQDKNRAWVQAGAGIIAQSTPQREWTETMEKLASIAPFVVAKNQPK